ncbi:MAG: hypothetical protein B9S38_17205, partial [Verrucomicrobiia bacterium Tous-C4TDCM]
DVWWDWIPENEEALDLTQEDQGFRRTGWGMVQATARPGGPAGRGSGSTVSAVSEPRASRKSRSASLVMGIRRRCPSR